MRTSGLLAFLAGAATGAVIALLFAPEKGEETRRRIVDKVKEGAEFTSENINELIDKLQEKAKKLGKTSKEA
ncbi:MAG: YtxH domain-containing protein [Bacteroidales bacterium]|nr:YtxH domain-containing protein [Bacteroidales bacterium]